MLMRHSWPALGCATGWTAEAGRAGWRGSREHSQRERGRTEESATSAVQSATMFPLAPHTWEYALDWPGRRSVTRARGHQFDITRVSVLLRFGSVGVCVFPAGRAYKLETSHRPDASARAIGLTFGLFPWTVSSHLSARRIFATFSAMHVHRWPQSAGLREGNTAAHKS
jgi:hypothetical protein